MLPYKTSILMSEVSFDFQESNYFPEKFKKLPIVPIILAYGNGQQEIIGGLLDSGSTNSFIDVLYAKLVNGIIIDSMATSGITSIIENKPVINVKISNEVITTHDQNESMDGKWVELKVGVIDTHHPNYNIILGRDFLELFKSICFDFENQKTTVNY
jgi:hypothetical protein